MRANEDKIAQLLDKTTDFDKDERYMATSDLCVELNKDVDLGPYLEPKVCVAVLKQLDDKSNDVQSIAVKCLGVLVTKVQVAQVADICAKLCDLILNGKPELRDIYSIGLKTIVADVSQTTGASIATGICTRLLTGLSEDKDAAVKAETLDILTDLLRRFGYDVATEHATIMELLMVQLTDESPLVRKRATACVGSLGVMASDVLVSRLVEHLIKGIQGSTDSSNVRTLIQTIGMLSRTAGHRLGQHLDAVIRILVQFCGNPEDESLQNEDSDELRGNCFQAFEAFVVRCHNEITPHVEVILKLVMQFISYDPNYNYVDSADEDEDMEEEEEEYSDEEGDYSDDDDTSWKVRRATLRVLTAIITTRPELLEQLYIHCAQPLISRFKEREENVRIDVFGVFAELLRATRKTLPSANGTGSFHPQTSNACVTQLEQRLNAIVVGANKQFGMKASVPSRCAVVAMLSELAMVEHGKLGDYIGRLMPNILNAVEDKHSDLKLDALLFLRLLVDTHTVEPFRSHIESVVKVAVQCAKGDWYKTVAKTLGLIESLVRIIRSDDGDSTYKPYAVPFFEAVLPSLKVHDIDQEIKEAAISSIGEIVAVLGDELDARVGEVYPLLMERLNNEITRVQSIKAIGVIARSKLNLDMSPILMECTQTLAQLLRQQSRTLKQATLATLNDLVVHKGANMPETLHREVVLEASLLLVDVDLQLCRMSITLVSNSLRVCPRVASTDALLQNAQVKALDLCHSSMLQGPTLDALKGLFAQLTQLNSPGSSFTELFKALMATPTEESKHSVLNIARCVAGTCVATTEENRKVAFAKFVGDITQTESEKNKVLALYCLGEFGRKIKLAGYTDVKELILKCFNNTGEEVKAAAAYSLGSICVGNMEEYLDTIMVKLELGENSYLLLTSLREVISDHAAKPHHDFAMYVDRVLPVLQKMSARQEEGVRNMVGECMGKLAVTNSTKIMPIVTELCGSSDVWSRWTAVTSLKYAMTTTAQEPAVNAIFAHIEPFLAALEDEDLHVRRAALLVLNTAAHHHTHYLVPYVRERIFPVLLKATEIKLERVVDLGPFKHKVDDGLPLRKAAYSCVETLIQVLPQQLDISLFFDQLKRGLGDQDDIQMLSHQILINICYVQPGSIVGALDSLVEPLEKTINKKVKEDQVGPEVERVKDLIRSALRALDAISTVRDTDSHPRLNVVMENAKKNKMLGPLLETIRSERASN
ncbi:Cullin-associated NEDD8-dissociated protein 1 [Phytophthora idaei]|nr:Cullin-associated NEDD8-dissociated protein 1 [Phytophthora idaei]KAG3146116.1 Cullin-associated NEDD8-dissociated protein 1 [Phytophthora idaei]KAG3240310.1 Cullin-associated NEDD8-dissociated protein 1 [Phytophthora idaei]